MKLATSVGLMLLTSVTLTSVASHSLDVEQTQPSSPTSIQKENLSRSQEYSFTFNRQPEVTYSNTLPESQNYLPLFPVLSAMGVDYEWDRNNNTVIIFEGDNTVKLQVGEDFQTRNGYQIPISVSKDSNGEIWIGDRPYNLLLLLGIDHISFDESEQKWQVYRFQQQTDGQTPLEKASADLIKDYLAMDLEQRAILSSPDTEITASSHALLEPELPVKDIEIKSARQLTAADDLNQGLVKVVVRYTTDYDGQPFKGFPDLGYNVPGETVHEQTFLVRANDGKMEIDNVIDYKANRTGRGSPIPLLEEEEYIQIGMEWQRKIKPPNASYRNLSQIVRDFVEPSLTRVNTNNDFHLPDLDDEEVLARFSEEVKQSQGWKDFLSLEGSKDPWYDILDATYSHDGKSLTATLIGNWVMNSITSTPILMEVKLVKDENNSWKFTRLANVRLYQNVRELELSEPETYSKLARFFSYFRFYGTGRIFFF